MLFMMGRRLSLATHATKFNGSAAEMQPFWYSDGVFPCTLNWLFAADFCAFPQVNSVSLGRLT